jgi:hypothetical protein
MRGPNTISLNELLELLPKADDFNNGLVEYPVVLSDVAVYSIISCLYELKGYRGEGATCEDDVPTKLQGAVRLIEEEIEQLYHITWVDHQGANFEGQVAGLKFALVCIEDVLPER